MDWLNELGPLAIGSRLRRLGELFTSEVASVYQLNDVAMSPRFFPLLSVLGKYEAMGVSEIAEALAVSHAAVSQMTKELEKQGWVASVVSDIDERKRLISLTKWGVEQLEKLQPLLNQIGGAVDNLLSETDRDLLKSIKDIEDALEKKSFSKRVGEKNSSAENISIVAWDEKYRSAFYDLNAEWIRAYFTMEPNDELSLGRPEEYYLKRGGNIFFVKLAGAVVGTCAIIEAFPGSFELSKMAVSSLVQGRGIGRKLLEHVIAEIKKQGADEIWLETSSLLQPAIRLYRKLGFVEEVHPRGGSNYRRAGIYMRLDLKGNGAT